jgi:hypothetical protein
VSSVTWVDYSLISCDPARKFIAETLSETPARYGRETPPRYAVGSNQTGAQTMYTTADYLITQSTAHSSGDGLVLYNAALRRGWLRRIGAALLGRNRTLRHLPQTTTTTQRRARVQTIGACEIAVRDIIGSEDRSGDFDIDFNPLRESLRDRWLNVFNAWARGVSLPPIELVRGPDGYYVRDGHHRLSVARALGHAYVEAVVTA